jgi:hypothetical protein
MKHSCFGRSCLTCSATITVLLRTRPRTTLLDRQEVDEALVDLSQAEAQLVVLADDQATQLRHYAREVVLELRVREVTHHSNYQRRGFVGLVLHSLEVINDQHTWV